MYFGVQWQPDNEAFQSFALQKAIVVIGLRQVGKTTFLESITEIKNYHLLNGDDPKIRTL